MFDRNRWVKVFKVEDTMKKKRDEKAFCLNDVKGMSLSTDDINDDVKGCNGLAIKRSIVLMKRKLCLRITTKLGNSKRQHWSWQKKKNEVGPIFLKNPKKKKKKRKEERRRRKYFFFYLHIKPQKHFIC